MEPLGLDEELGFTLAPSALILPMSPWPPSKPSVQQGPMSALAKVGHWSFHSAEPHYLRAGKMTLEVVRAVRGAPPFCNLALEDTLEGRGGVNCS